MARGPEQFQEKWGPVFRPEFRNNKKTDPAFASGRQVWPLTGMGLAALEPDDPRITIPPGALQNGARETSERHFAANQNSAITQKPVEPLGPKPAGGLNRKWKLALLASCVLHVAVALFFAQATDNDVLMEGADYSGVAYLGSGADQLKAGEVSEAEDAVDVTMVTMLDAVPVETIEAEAVPTDDVARPDFPEAVTAEPERLQPVEETPVEQVQPADRAETVTVESTPAPAVTEAVPEVLATDRVEPVDDDNVVQKLAETQAAEPVDAGETVAVEPAESQRVETAEVTKAEPVESKPLKPEPENKPVEEKAEPAKPVKDTEKKPAIEKKNVKTTKAEKAQPKKSGNGGKSEANSRRGQVDGDKKGDSQQASRGGSKNGEVGNAAASNYPGKVRSKLARVARSIRAKGRGEVVVAFAVGSGGDVRSARVTRSSGVASVDKAALQAIRKAAPFPPIPANAGRSSWEFSIPLAFMR